MPFRRALALMAIALNMPFGYTLATWSSATIASHYLGLPGPIEVFAYVGGGIVAYLAVALLSAPHLGPVNAVRMRRATMINVFAAIAAAVASVAVQVTHSPVIGFFAAGLTSTATYILSLAFLLWWSAPRRPLARSARARSSTVGREAPDSR